jgi:hypothetical protein
MSHHQEKSSAVAALAMVGAVAASLLTAAPASAGPLCSTLSNIPLSSFVSCVASGQDTYANVQAVLNAVLDPDVTLIGSQSYYPGPPVGGKAGDAFGGDVGGLFDITPNSVGGSRTFTFNLLPPGTDFITMKQATSFEIFNVVGLSAPFTLTHQITPPALTSGATSHISTWASTAEPPPPPPSLSPPSPVPEPASMVLLGSALLGFGVLRRRKQS